MNLIDIKGETFNRLTALKRIEKEGDKRTYWLFSCSCGGETIVLSYAVRKGKVKSCGCLQSERAREWAVAQTGHGMTGTPTYETWHGMRQRVNNPNNVGYKNYGARGITVCERWDSFENFLHDMGERPPEMTLERTDNNKGYSPENCRWATRKEQSNNRRSNVMLTFRKRTQTIAEWSAELDITIHALHNRLRRGWTVERALSTPMRRRK